MWRVVALAISLFVIFGTKNEALANDCVCQTVQANGKGNTSCSASESGGKCTIDYNLFSPAAEQRAAQLLTSSGVNQLVIPSPGTNTVQSLLELSDKGGADLVDAVLIYLMVATADRILDGTAEISSQTLQGLVQTVTPYRNNIESAFNGQAMRQWLGTPTEKLSPNPVRDGLTKSFGNRNDLVIAPGCIEVRRADLWVMFKAPWSPMRIRPRCGE